MAQLKPHSRKLIYVEWNVDDAGRTTDPHGYAFKVAAAQAYAYRRGHGTEGLPVHAHDATASADGNWWLITQPGLVERPWRINARHLITLKGKRLEIQRIFEVLTPRQRQLIGLDSFDG